MKDSGPPAPLPVGRWRKDLSFWRQRGFSLRTAAEDLSLQRLAFIMPFLPLLAPWWLVVAGRTRMASRQSQYLLGRFTGTVSALPLQVPVKGFSLLYSTLPVADKPAHEPLFTPMRKQAAGKTAAGRRRRFLPGFWGTEPLMKSAGH